MGDNAYYWFKYWPFNVANDTMAIYWIHLISAPLNLSGISAI